LYLILVIFFSQGGNYQEYFAKKMAELKARGKPTFHSLEEDATR
jgi:hypothetical protein